MIRKIIICLTALFVTTSLMASSSSTSFSKLESSLNIDTSAMNYGEKKEKKKKMTAKEKKAAKKKKKADAKKKAAAKKKADAKKKAAAKKKADAKKKAAAKKKADLNKKDLPQKKSDTEDETVKKIPDADKAKDEDLATEDADIANAVM